MPPERLTASRLAGLFGAGLAGGIVGSIVGGAVVAPVVMIFGPGKSAALDAGVLAAIGRGVTGGALGALLGYPLGVARGLRSAGALLRLRGRYWPTVGGAYIGLLLVLLLGPGVCWLTAMRWLPLAWVLAMLLTPWCPSSADWSASSQRTQASR